MNKVSFGIDQFSNYKRLDGGVYFVDDLPMTPSGKVVRSKVKEIAQNGYQAKKTMPGKL